ncbi:MAG: hypothetical protein U0Q16_07155 [Bryobacteraceae bacterium]
MPRPLLALAAVLAAYAVIAFLLVPANTLTGFPVHHDDFRNLSWIHPTLPEPARPVSGFLLTLLSSFGIPTYYIALHALVVAYAALVIAALARLFHLRPAPPALAFAAALALLSVETMVEFSKYTGLITGLLSGVTGAAAVALLLSRPSRPATLAGAIALTALSGFSKEDFLLPILITATLLAWEQRDRRSIALLGAIGLLTAAVFAYNRSVSAVYTSGASQFYRQDFRLSSIAMVAEQYLLTSRGAAIAALLQLATLTWNVIAARPIPWPRMLAFHAIATSIALPYLCLPGHTAPYYVFHWAPWQLAGGILVLWKLRPGIPAAAAIAALVLCSIALTQSTRRSIVEWYRTNQTVNRNIVRTLEANRALIAPHPTAAVEGAPPLSPWFATSGEFLVNRFGFPNRWLIRTPLDGSFAREFQARAGSLTMGRNTVVPLDSELPPGVPVVKLAPGGNGTASAAR